MLDTFAVNRLIIDFVDSSASYPLGTTIFKAVEQARNAMVEEDVKPLLLWSITTKRKEGKTMRSYTIDTFRCVPEVPHRMNWAWGPHNPTRWTPVSEELYRDWPG